MQNDTFIEGFIENIRQDVRQDTDQDQKFDWGTLITVLVMYGIPIVLPELKAWIKLGMSAVALQREAIKKKLIAYAAERELDFPEAELAAEKVVENIDESNVQKKIEAFDKER